MEIANELVAAERARNHVKPHLENYRGNTDINAVYLLMTRAEPVMDGLVYAVNSMLGLESGVPQPKGLVFNARILDTLVHMSSETDKQAIYRNPKLIRGMAERWVGRSRPFHNAVNAKLHATPWPITSLQVYAGLDPHMQEAYARFHELCRCLGRGAHGHDHGTVIKPTWVEGNIIEPVTRADALLNVALSSEIPAGKYLGGFSSDSCAADHYLAKTQPGVLAVIGDKSTALYIMLGSLRLGANTPEEVAVPLFYMKQSYGKIAAAAAPSLKSFKPVTESETVGGL